MYRNSDSDFNLAMAASESFEALINQVRLSNLNFRMEMTPFSARILLKKSLIKGKTGYPHQLLPQTINFSQDLNQNQKNPSDLTDLTEQLKELKKNLEAEHAKNKTLKNAYNTVKDDLEDALYEIESNHREIDNLKTEDRIQW